MDTSKTKILVVEDDFGLRAVLTRILYSIDPHMDLTWVASVSDARVALRIEKYSLVICDYSLIGRATGLDLWHVHQKKYADTPFMFLSSLEIPKFLKLLGNGAIPPFLHKPFYPRDCQNMITSLLAKGA